MRMKIIAVDDEKLMLERICRCINEVEPDLDVKAFKKASEAIEYAQNNPIDVAFLDIHMRGMDGIELARNLIRFHPRMNIIFCTGHSEYIFDAVSDIRCSGYILKPATVEQVKKELENLRYAVENSNQKRVYCRCFGNFEVFVDDKAIAFETAKAKELLAYLVDRKGAVCSNAEIMAALWEDEEDHYSYLKKCKKALVKAFAENGREDIIINQRGGMGIDREKIECDYYNWLDGKKEGSNAFRDEYMTQYSWGEVTNATLHHV